HEDRRPDAVAQQRAEVERRAVRDADGATAIHDRGFSRAITRKRRCLDRLAHLLASRARFHREVRQIRRATELLSADAAHLSEPRGIMTAYLTSAAAIPVNPFSHSPDLIRGSCPGAIARAGSAVGRDGH